jgi:hypothetical protein
MDTEMAVDVNVNVFGPDGLRSLHRAMKPWNGAEVRRLVGAGADVNASMRFGWSVLDAAADAYALVVREAVARRDTLSDREKAGWKDTLGPLWEQRPRYVEVTLESLAASTVLGRLTNRMLNDLGFVQLSDEVSKELFGTRDEDYDDW